MSTPIITQEAKAGTITIEDFAKLDLLVGVILHCQAVDNSEKLLQLTVDIGTAQRHIFAGIQSSYRDPAALIGRKVIVVANLAPRKMRFGVSEGMVLCASAPDAAGQLFLLDVDAGATPGMQVG